MSENDDNEFENNNTSNDDENTSNNEEEIIKKGDDYIDIVNDNTDENSSNNNLSIDENSDLDFFDENNENIIIQEKVIKEEHEIEYDEDEIYINDLENQFLSEYPVIKQNLKYIQKEAFEKAKNVLELKNLGLSIIRDKENNKIVKNYLSNRFNKHFIIPIVFDRKRKYRQIDTNNIVGDEEITQTEIDEFKGEGIYTDDQRDQLKKLKQLEKKKLHYTEYLKEVNELIRPYINYSNDIKNGIKISVKESTEVLRQFNSDKFNWENRFAISGHKYNETSINEDTGELETDEKILTEDEHINISGFFKLPVNSNNLYSKDHIDRFSKINNITKIEFKDKLHITLEDHNLESGSVIFINNSNSSPSIDGKHIIDNIINKNEFTIDMNINNGINGTKAECYTLYLLSYRSHSIKKEKGKFKISNLMSDKQVDNTPNIADLYLIEGEIDKKEYGELLNVIIPSYENILNRENDNIKDMVLYNDIEDVLLKYDISIQDLDINGFNVIKKILKENINKKTPQNYKNRPTQNNVQKISPLITLENSDLYSDKYLKSDIVKEYYGEYPLFGKKYDSYSHRASFINDSNDLGQLYYLFVLSNKNKELLQKYDINKLKLALKDLNKELQNKTIKLEDEKKIAKFINKDPCELNNNVLENEKTEYSSLKHICDFSNTDIEKLDIQKLQCYYFSNSCKNKKIHRLEERIELLTGIISKIEGIIKYSDSNIFNKYYKDIIQIHKDKLEFEKIKHIESNSNDEDLKKLIPEQSDCKINKVIDKIIQEKNEGYKRYLLFKLIEQDGLLIDKTIYSKTFKCPIICGHWHYLRRIYNSDTEEQRELLHNEMCGIYGDGGEVSGDIEICKVCGNRLGLKKYDDIDGFDTEGKLKIARQEWVEDEVLTDKKDINFYKIYTHEQFSKYILNKGIKHSDTKIAMDIAIIIKNISMKIGIQFTHQDFLDIILDSFNIIIELPDYKKYRMKEILKLKTKGFSKEKIIKLDENKFFEKTYKKTHLLKKVGIISAKILIYIQIAIPNYKRRKTDIKCVFHTFDSDEGVKYMSCVIDEMKYFEDVFDRRDKDKDEKILDAVDFSYKQTLNQMKYKDAIYKKQQYIQDQEPVIIENKKSEFKRTNIIIQNDFNTKLKSSSGDEMKKLISNYHIYSKNISENIVNIIEKYIHSSIKIEPTIETSCCEYKVGDNNITYYSDVSKNYSNIMKLIEETKRLMKYTNLIKIDGVFTRLYYPHDIEYDIKGDFPFIIDEYITEDIIQDTFLTYCSKGTTAGEQHTFMEGTCIKCGAKIKDIKSNKKTEDEFEELLSNIIKNTVNIKTKKNINDNNDIKNFQKAKSLEQTIRKFNKNINKFNKDPKKYTYEYFNEIGLYKNIYNVDIAKNDKEKILLKNKLYNTRVEVLKTLLIQYFNKYISLIKNKMLEQPHTLLIEDDDNKVISDIQVKINKEYDEMKQFVEKNHHIFKIIKIKEKIKDINNVKYINHIYNCDYSKILKHSSYTNVDASNYLLNILFENLNDFFDKIKEDDEIRTLTIFILKIFDIFENNSNIVNIDEEKINSIEMSIDSVKSSKKSPLDKVQTKNPHLYIEDQDEIDAEIEVNKKNKEDKLIEMIKDDILEKDGVNATPNDIEVLKDEYLHNEEIDHEINEDEEGIDSGDIEAEFGIENDDILN